MGASIPLGDVVGEAQHGLVVAVVPPQGEIDLDPFLLAADDDDVLEDGRLGLVEVAHEGLDPAFIVQDLLELLGPAMVLQLDDHARVEEGELAQAVLERLQVEVDVGEGGDRGVEGDLGARQDLAIVAQRRVARDAQALDRVAALEPHLVAFAVAIDDQLQPVGQGVDDGDADAVQAARDLVGILVELTAGVQLGHDDLGSGDALLAVDVGGDAAAVVGDRDRAVGVEDDLDQVGVAGEGLVDGVVDHLIDHVVQTRAVVGVADIHAGPFADCVEALEDLDGIGAVGGLFGGVFVTRGRGLIGHIFGR